MRLSLFRQKLTYEVKEVATIIATSEHLDQEVQAHFSCIAALLRKIMTRLTRFQNFQIPVLRGEEKNIRLHNLVNTILHYSNFYPGFGSDLTRSGTLEVIRIQSDKQSDFLEIKVMDFIEIAKQIAEDDGAILDNLLDHTKKRLGRIIHAPCVRKSDEIEAAESLMDFFELVRETGSISLPGGKITLFQEKRKDMLTVTGLDTCEIDYDILFRKLFNEWFFVPFRQFKSYSSDFDELKFEGRIITLESYANEDLDIAFKNNDSNILSGRIFDIRVKDLFDVLCAMEKEIT